MPLRAALAALVLAARAAAADATDPDTVRSTAVTVTKDLEVQSRLPNDSSTPEASSKTRPDRWSPFGSEGVFAPAPAAVFQLMVWALAAGAAVAFIALLVILIREPIQSRFRPTVTPGGLEPDEPPPADPRELLARADSLAAAGRYSEAMHCVLLAATTMLGRGRPHKSSDSLTSWELLRTATLAPPQLHALRDLVIHAERAWFGQRPAGPDDYQQARGSFHVFASTAEGDPA